MGARQLAGNIIKVAGIKDPAAIKDFLGDVLADSDNQLVPAAERAASLQFLAAEQRSEIRTGLVALGEQMVDSMGENGTKVRDEIGKVGSIAKRGVATVNEDHDRQVGRHFRDSVDTRDASRAHEDVAQTARKGYGAVTKHSETFDGWAKSQQQEAKKFNDEFDKGRNHE